MRLWEIKEIEGKKIPLPKINIVCPFCATPMLLHDFFCYWSQPWQIHHVDVHMKCPECSYHATFGVPLSREEYEELKRSPLHGKLLKDLAVKLAETQLHKVTLEKMKKRLESWGYW